MRVGNFNGFNELNVIAQVDDGRFIYQLRTDQFKAEIIAVIDQLSDQSRKSGDFLRTFLKGNFSQEVMNVTVPHHSLSYNTGTQVSAKEIRSS